MGRARVGWSVTAAGFRTNPPPCLARMGLDLSLRTEKPGLLARWGGGTLGGLETLAWLAEVVVLGLRKKEVRVEERWVPRSHPVACAAVTVTAMLLSSRPNKRERE